MQHENDRRVDGLVRGDGEVTTPTLTAKTMTDADLCQAIGEDLTEHYPGHPWAVGVDLESGSVTIRLGYPYPGMPATSFGYLLHPATVVGPGGQHRVMQAGGELLERYQLARGAATDESADRAAENGLITEDTDDGAWLARKARGG